MLENRPPRILIIAGSDSGGGAGIQADIKTVTMMGGHAMTAITAITAQNTLGVDAVMPVPTDMVMAQIRAVVDDIGVDAIKIGMIGSAETATALAEYLHDERPQHKPFSHSTLLSPVPVVFDPVMVATSGAKLADTQTIIAFDRLMKLASLTTPNLPELEALGGHEELQRNYVMHLIKGGHGEGDAIIDRLYLPPSDAVSWMDSKIHTRNTHGTGCTLASAIAVGLARGMSMQYAVEQARRFVRLSILDAPDFGGGHGPMGQQSVREDAMLGGLSLNQVTIGCSDYAASVDFYTRLGLKQIVDAPENGYARFEAANGVTFSIHKGGAPSDSNIVYFENPDLFNWCKQLEAKGFVFEQTPRNEEWKWDEARLRDPHGNIVCLYRAGINRRYPPWRIN